MTAANIRANHEISPADRALLLKQTVDTLKHEAQRIFGDEAWKEYLKQGHASWMEKLLE